MYFLLLHCLVNNLIKLFRFCSGFNIHEHIHIWVHCFFSLSALIMFFPMLVSCNLMLSYALYFDPCLFFIYKDCWSLSLDRWHFDGSRAQFQRGFQFTAVQVICVGPCIFKAVPDSLISSKRHFEWQNQRFLHVFKFS